MNHGQKRADLLQLVRLQRNAENSYNELIEKFEKTFPEFSGAEREEEKIRILTPVSPKQNY